MGDGDGFFVTHPSTAYNNSLCNNTNKGRMPVVVGNISPPRRAGRTNYDGRDWEDGIELSYIVSHPPLGMNVMYRISSPQ